MLTAPSILFYLLLVPLFSCLSILIYTWIFLTFCPLTRLLFANPAHISYPTPDASDFPYPEKLVSYTKESNFEPSNQIIVPTVYKTFFYLPHTLYIIFLPIF